MQINSGPNSSDTENRLSDTEDVLSSSPSPNYNSLEPSAKEIARYFFIIIDVGLLPLSDIEILIVCLSV